MSKLNGFEQLKIFLFKKYSENPDRMLIHTGVIGWAMSSLAQIVAIIFNDKVPKEQKMFMIPQEFADAVTNILSFYLVTRSITGIANKAVKIGKLLPQNINKYFTLAYKNLKAKKVCGLGNWNFDVEKQIPKHLNEGYMSFKNGVSLIATLVGTVVSCNIITPIFRNIYASHRQKQNIAKMNTPKDPNKPQSKYAKYNPLQNKNIYSFTNRGDLKI